MLERQPRHLVEGGVRRGVLGRVRREGLALDGGLAAHAAAALRDGERLVVDVGVHGQFQQQRPQLIARSAPTSYFIIWKTKKKPSIKAVGGHSVRICSSIMTSNL